MNNSKLNDLQANIPIHVLSKLDCIRRFLKSGKASVMVGAGFSKNAIMDESTEMKNWEELASDFYFRIYNKHPNATDLKLRSSLRLASQVEAISCRHELEEIIMNSLPDKKIRPGVLHKLLVSINWKDIFTTNYDTLLERTAKEYANQSYALVTNKETLLYQSSPRIIKLHGSFPDMRPFIITEEDYRTYPDKYPELVNTVRQALIENLLCLIGFSGDDPNFLNWVGWLRDVMGERVLPIYMFSFGSDISEAEMKLFSARKIDIIPLGQINSDSVKALEIVLDYIKQPVEEEMWDGRIKKYRNNKYIDYELNTNEEINETLNRLASIRHSYPNWIILPEDKLADLRDVESEIPFIGHKISKLDINQRISLLYEIEWRINISYTPISLFDWFEKEAVEVLSANDGIEEVNSKKLNTIRVALLAYYRWHNRVAEFEKLSETINKDVVRLTLAEYRRFRYEQALFYIVNLKYDEVIEVLNNWVVTPADYVGVLWRSAILLEIGQIKEALSFLETAYQTLCKERLTNGETPLNISSLTVFERIISLCKNAIGDFQNHTNTFQDSKCNFNSISHLFINKIRVEKEKVNSYGLSEQRNHGFNIRQITTTNYIGSRGIFPIYLNAYRYIRSYELFGMPLGFRHYMINSDYLQMVLKIILPKNFHVGFFVIQRSGNKNLIPTITREVLKNISQEDADNIFHLFLNAIKGINDFKDYKSWRICAIAFSLLSRLSVRSSEKNIVEFLKVLFNLYENNVGLFDNKYLETPYRSLSLEKYSEILPILFELPIGNIGQNEDISFPYRKGLFSLQVSVSDKAIRVIKEAFLSDKIEVREKAYIRLAKVYQFCSQDQKLVLNEVVIKWRNQDSKLMNARYSYNLVNHNDADEKSVKDFVESSLNKLCNLSEHTQKNIIEELSEILEEIVPYASKLTSEQLNVFFKSLTLVIQDNFKIFIESDSKFIRIFNNWNEDIYKYIVRILDRVDFKDVPLRVILNLQEQMEKLREKDEAVLSIIAILSQKSNKRYASLKRNIEKHIVFGTAENLEQYFSSALFVDMHLDVNFMSKILSFIEYTENPNVVLYIDYLIDVCERNKLERKIYTKIAGVMEKIHNTLGNYNLSEDEKTDIQYCMIKLAGVLSTHAVPEKLKKTIDNWRTFSLDENTFNDVRAGFDEGASVSGNVHNIV